MAEERKFLEYTVHTDTHQSTHFSTLKNWLYIQMFYFLCFTSGFVRDI